MWATTPVRPFDDSASNLKRILCAFGLAIHELTAACLALNRETQGAFSTRSTRPSRSYACLGWYWDESHYRVPLMTVSSQRGEKLGADSTRKKAALKTRAAALLSSKLGKPATRVGNCRPTPGGDYNNYLYQGDHVFFRKEGRDLQVSS